MESPKKPSRGRGEDEERILKLDSATRMSGGIPRNPKQVLKNQSDNPGRVTNWTGPPDHKKLRRQRNNSGEREDLAHQNKKAKGQSCNPSRQRRTILGPSQGGDHAMWKGHCPKQHPYRYAKNRRLGLTPGRGVMKRI